MIDIGPIQGNPPSADNQIASEVPSTPAGTIVATDVQAAINELDGEKLANIIEDTSPQLGGDLDGQGNYLVNVQNIFDLAAKGAGYYFGGANDYIKVDDNINLNFDADIDFSIVLDYTVQRTSVLQHLIKKGGLLKNYNLKQNSDDTIIFSIDDDIAKVQATSDATVNLYARYSICIISNRTGNLQIYINGTPNGNPVDISGVASIDDITTPYAIGIASENLTTDPANIGVTRNLLFNFALTTAEMQAFSNGAPIPYKYIGASQTELVTAQNDRDFSAGNIGNWTTVTDGNGTCAYDVGPGAEKTAKLTVGTTPGTYLQGRLAASRLATMITGKRYLLKANVYMPSANNHFNSVAIGFGGMDKSDIVTVEADLAIEDQWQTITQMITVGQNFSGYLIMITSGITTGDVAYFDDVSLTQIGCVLQLEQDSINHSQWLDKSGNKLHGEVDGAIAINLLSDHIEQYQQLIVMTNDTTWTDVVPTGYELEKIIFVESAGNQAILDLGTATGTSGIFVNQVIAASSITTVVINKTFSMSAVQSLFLNDDDAGSSWNSASITATLIMRRIK